MNNYSPEYLERLNAYSDNIALFVGRVPGIATSTDRQSVIRDLTPTHHAALESVGIEPGMLSRENRFTAIR